MSQEIKISKKVYDRGESNEVFKKDITHFVTGIDPNTGETTTVETAQLPTIEEFFIYYDRLFNEIPREGNINSHRYLVDRSSTVLPEQDSTQDIQPLLDEIARLRRELLNTNQQIIDLTLQNSGA